MFDNRCLQVKQERKREEFHDQPAFLLIIECATKFCSMFGTLYTAVVGLKVLCKYSWVELIMFLCLQKAMAVVVHFITCIFGRD